MDKLKPCPFCGNIEPRVQIPKGNGAPERTSTVYCNCCHALVPLQIWNRRQSTSEKE